MIYPSFSIKDVKSKIENELHFTCARLILDNYPLDDQQCVSASNLKPGTLIRCAMARQNRQKRKINTGPGSKERRQIKAQRAANELKLLLAAMTPDQLALTLQQIEGARFCRSILEAKADLCRTKEVSKLMKSDRERVGRLMKSDRERVGRLMKRLRLLNPRSVSNFLFSL